MSFIAAETPQQIKAIIVADVKKTMEDEDALGAAACLMQNHRFLIGQDRVDDLACNWSRFICKLGDAKSCGNEDTNEGLRC